MDPDIAEAEADALDILDFNDEEGILRDLVRASVPLDLASLVHTDVAGPLYWA